MADIIELANYYKEDVLKRVLKGTIQNTSNIHLREGLPLYFLDQGLRELKFTVGNDILTVKLEDDTILDESTNLVEFYNLYWVSKIGNKGDNHIEISRLRCPRGKVLLADQHLCIGNEYIRKLPGKTNIQNRLDSLKRNLVFSDGNYEYLLIQTFPAADEANVQIILHGIHSEAKVCIKEGKWIITSSTKPNSKNLSTTIDKYLSYTIQRYKSVSIVEESEAKEALNELEIQTEAGNTLLALWKKYSILEKEEKEKLRDELQAMQFTFLEPLPNGKTRIRLNVTNTVWSTFYLHRYELMGERLEFATKMGKPIKLDIEENLITDTPDDEEEDDDESSYNPFVITKIGKDRVLEISDECYLIRTDGYFILSTRGNQTMDDRRQRALQNIRKKDSNVLRALHLAIEDMAESIPSTKTESYEPTTDRTRAYLKKNFGIDDLTDEQKKAVKMALESPDIALIQGPPGTGKTTVIAAICDRLEEEVEKLKIELASKGRKYDESKKLFLISAFQNDTVEHIASKINTYGIPTPKIGKDAGAIRAEEKFIVQMKTALNKTKEKLESINRKRVSYELKRLSDSLADGSSISKVKNSLDEILRTYEIPSDLRKEWDEHTKKEVEESYFNEKWISALESLVTTADRFLTEGKKPLMKLSIQKLGFTAEEKKLFTKLYSAKSVTDDDLKPLIELQNKYLSQLRQVEGKQEDDDSFLPDWIERLRHYFIEKEESSYADKDTFIAAVIDSMLEEDLSGNNEHILSSIKEYSRSIAATNQAAGGKKVAVLGDVRNVILEEAARSNPLDLLIPMTRAENKIIMVGDQMQLPHILEPKLADEAVADIQDEDLKIQYRNAYNESLFGRIFCNVQKENVLPKRFYTLKQQFRMHPIIGNFVSETYYQGELKCFFPDAEQAAKKLHGLSFPLVKDKVAIFVDVPFSEGPEISMRSKYRLAECNKVMEILDSIFKDPQGKNVSVGVITFYRQQRDEIMKMASAPSRGYTEDKGDEGYSISAAYRYTDEENPRERLRIGSVDSFQGKEFDVVILSTVRSNDIDPSSTEQQQKFIQQYNERFKREIASGAKKVISGETAKEELLKRKFGFLMLENRLNVAFSRAQKLLITIGDGNMFCSDDAYAYVHGLYEFHKQFSTEKI